MIKNFIIIALRNIQRHRFTSIVNIFGLAIGLACCLFILLWIVDELSFDKFHDDSDQIFQVLGNGRYSSTPMPLAAALKDNFAEVTYASRIESIGEPLIQRGEKAFYQPAIAVDPDFFKIFTFPFLQGDPSTVMEDVYSVVISKRIADLYFPGENPLGKVLNMNDKWDFTITGVTQNPASNSTLPFDIAIHFDYRIKEAASLGADPFSWGWWSPNTFIKLDKTASIESFNSKMTALFQAKMREHDNDFFNLLPLTERRFFFWDTRQYIIIFSAIALLVLFIANINFINLMTAQSANRVKEIGIRKVSGAVRKSLIYQFLGESLILTIISLFFALLIAGLLLPFFNSITGKQFAPDMVLRPTIICLLTGLVLITGFASGGYPALLLSSFKPIMMLKRQPLVFSGAGLRKSLVVMQFSISIALIICAGAVFSQLRYIKSKDIGYAKEQLITISLKGEGQEFYDTLRKKLESDHRILGVTGMADDLPHFSWTSSTQHWEGKDQTREIHLGFNMVDYNIVNTLELKLVEGKDFTSEFLTANETGFLINEKLADLIGRESIVGRPFSSFDKTGKIMGVFQNTHFLPLTTQINPFYFMFSRERLFNMVIRIPNENLQASVQFIKESWKEIIPMYPFEYRFVDETFDRAYSNIERMDKLVNVFTVIAIVLACLGLFCLALFTIEQRTKEIGIRKILGAYVPGIVIMLSKEFLKWVVLANIFAWPVAFLIIHKWLENFAYRIQLNVRLFLLSGGLALIIAIITISWQAVGAAMAPPVRALRYE